MTHHVQASSRPSLRLRISSLRSAMLLGLALAATTPDPAAAYIGPGAGLGAIGAIVALFGAIVLLIVGFVWYPVKRLLGRSKTKSAARDESNPDAT